MIDVAWNELKTIAVAKDLPLQYVDVGPRYIVYIADGPISLITTISKIHNADDVAEFEASFKGKSNRPIAQVNYPFTSKVMNGYKLYRRVHGQVASLVANGDTLVEFEVPYALCKIDEVQLVWFPEGVTCDFTVACPPIPDPLSQHAFTVPVAENFHTEKSSYDATLVTGIVLQMTLHNTTEIVKTVGVTWVLHEMIYIT